MNYLHNTEKDIINDLTHGKYIISILRRNMLPDVNRARAVLSKKVDDDYIIIFKIDNINKTSMIEVHETKIKMTISEIIALITGVEYSTYNKDKSESVKVMINKI